MNRVPGVSIWWRLTRPARVSLQFRATDTVRWERASIDISGMETEQDLLNELDDAVQNLQDGAQAGRWSHASLSMVEVS